MIAKISYLKNAVLYVEAKGKLDIYTAQDYFDEIKDYLNRKYTTELILDFSNISYVASIGLRGILELYKITQTKECPLKLKNVNEEVLKVLKVAGFDKFLTIENDSDEDINQN